VLPEVVHGIFRLRPGHPNHNAREIDHLGAFSWGKDTDSGIIEQNWKAVRLASDDGLYGLDCQRSIFNNLCSAQKHDAPNPEAKLLQTGKIGWLHIEGDEAGLRYINLSLSDAL